MNTQSNNAPFTNNTLLAALPENELSLLWPHLQHVSIVLHQVLHEPGNRIEDIYFVESGLVSITANTGDRSQVEVGLVGRDGMVGEVLLIDPQAMVVNRALVQAPGTALRIRADILLGLLDQCPTLTRMGRLGLHYTLLQATQTAACNARHETPQRLARWLLMAQDRLDSDELPMTQEFLSYFLGVRRAGVSAVAGDLKERGVIRQSRGKITIIDRALLERESCGCYEILAEQWRLLLGPRTAARPYTNPKSDIAC